VHRLLQGRYTSTSSNIDFFLLECGVVCWVVVCLCDRIHAFTQKIFIIKFRTVRISNLPQLKPYCREKRPKLCTCLNLLLHSMLIVSSSYMHATDNEGNMIMITYVVSYLMYIQTLATYFLSLASLTTLCPLNSTPG
jgi:hypothetical protein